MVCKIAFNFFFLKSYGICLEMSKDFCELYEEYKKVVKKLETIGKNIDDLASMNPHYIHNTISSSFDTDWWCNIVVRYNLQNIIANYIKPYQSRYMMIGIQIIKTYDDNKYKDDSWPYLYEIKFPFDEPPYDSVNERDELYESFLKMVKVYHCYSCRSFFTYSHSNFDCREYKNLCLKYLYDLQQSTSCIDDNYLCLQEQVDAVTTKLDKFDSKHKSDCEHMRLDVETCADIIDRNTKQQKVYCDETNLYVNDLQDRISRLESLLCESVDSQIIDRILNINKESESLEQIVKKQQQTINELQAELKKQREEFEEYKSQRQQQLAAIMSQM